MNEPLIRALRGPGPLRLRREKSARNRSEIGWVGSSNRSQRNFSVSGEDSNALVMLCNEPINELAVLGW